jgi:predicted phosphodiesterase
MRVMVLGDTHGDVRWCEKVTRLAGRNNASWVLQVGDFGWFPNMRTHSGRPHSEFFAEAIDRACHLHGVDGWIFLDGNHDNHADLHARVERVDGCELVPLSDHLWYSPRGNVFELDGVRFGTLGGATSIDAWLEDSGVVFSGPPYVAGHNWWPDLEQPTEEDVSRLLLNEPVDVLLTHEAPLEMDLKRYEGFKGIYIPPEIQQRARRSRAMVSTAAIALTPKVLIHGHWHGRYSGIARYGDLEVPVEGLAANNMRTGRDTKALLYIDLPEVKVIDGSGVVSRHG